MGVPRQDDIEATSTQLHCFLAEGVCGGVGLLGTSTALGLLAEPPAPSSSEAVGQRTPTSPNTVSSWASTLPHDAQELAESRLRRTARW